LKHGFLLQCKTTIATENPVPKEWTMTNDNYRDVKEQKDSTHNDHEIEKRPTLLTAGIKAFSREELQNLVREMGLPSFRAQQIEQWLYGKGARSYEEMTNLPKKLREELEGSCPLYYPSVLSRQVSMDGTRKYLLRFHDGTTVETVGLPSKTRLTVCFSTQAGCPMRCAFCATGKSGFTRNLAPGEMVDQIRVVAEDFGKRPTNAVAMGQGEPFLNYDNVISALRFVNAKDGFNVGARHITVSTCGVLPQIRRFAAEPEQFTLAVSLHSAVQETRDELMPGVRQYRLDRLHDSLASYIESTGRRVTLEYSMIDGVNDTDDQLNALVSFCRKLLCHVNLIPVNAVSGSKYMPSNPERVAWFCEQLQRIGIECTVRISRGSDIAGACGQLRQKNR
jgi:23S rRNA (adenine2503-C2)-methyltransferase